MQRTVFNCCKLECPDLCNRSCWCCCFGRTFWRSTTTPNKYAKSLSYWYMYSLIWIKFSTLASFLLMCVCVCVCVCVCGSYMEPHKHPSSNYVLAMSTACNSNIPEHTTCVSNIPECGKRDHRNVARSQRFGYSHSIRPTQLKTATAPVCGTLAWLWTTIGDPTQYLRDRDNLSTKDKRPVRSPMCPLFGGSPVL